MNKIKTSLRVTDTSDSPDTQSSIWKYNKHEQGRQHDSPKENIGKEREIDEMSERKV